MKPAKLPGDDARHSANPRRRHIHALESGFSLVEVVVAMMLFALVSVAVLPLIIGVTQLTVVNSDSVQAKAAAQQKLAAIQREYPTDPSVQVSPSRPIGQTLNCSALPVAAPLAEEATSGLSMVTTAGPCPTVFPGTVPVHIVVTDASGDVIATVNSSVRVTQ